MRAIKQIESCFAIHFRNTIMLFLLNQELEHGSFMLGILKTHKAVKLRGKEQVTDNVLQRDSLKVY